MIETRTYRHSWTPVVFTILPNSHSTVLFIQVNSTLYICSHFYAYYLFSVSQSIVYGADKDIITILNLQIGKLRPLEARWQFPGHILMQIGTEPRFLDDGPFPCHFTHASSKASTPFLWCTRNNDTPFSTWHCLKLDGGSFTGATGPPKSTLSPSSAYVKFAFEPLSIVPLSTGLWKGPGDHGQFLAPFEESTLDQTTAHYLGLNILSQYCFLQTDSNSLLLSTQGDNSRRDLIISDIVLAIKKKRKKE